MNRLLKGMFMLLLIVGLAATAGCGGMAADDVDISTGTTSTTVAKWSYDDSDTDISPLEVLYRPADTALAATPFPHDLNLIDGAIRYLISDAASQAERLITGSMMYLDDPMRPYFELDGFGNNARVYFSLLKAPDPATVTVYGAQVTKDVDADGVITMGLVKELVAGEDFSVTVKNRADGADIVVTPLSLHEPGAHYVYALGNMNDLEGNKFTRTGRYNSITNERPNEHPFKNNEEMRRHYRYVQAELKVMDAIVPMDNILVSTTITAKSEGPLVAQVKKLIDEGNPVLMGFEHVLFQGIPVLDTEDVEVWQGTMVTEAIPYRYTPFAYLTDASGQAVTDDRTGVLIPDAFPVLWLKPKVASTKAVVGINGLGSNRFEMAMALSKQGVNVFTIDVVRHGITPSNPLYPILGTDIERNPWEAMLGYGVFINWQDALASSYNLFQIGHDIPALIMALRNQAADLGIDKDITLAGHSLGAISSVVATQAIERAKLDGYDVSMVEPESIIAVTPAGGIGEHVLSVSPALKLMLDPQLAAVGIIDGTRTYDKFWTTAQMAVDMVDPLTLAVGADKVSLDAPAFLIIEQIGDLVTTEYAADLLAQRLDFDKNYLDALPIFGDPVVRTMIAMDGGGHGPIIIDPIAQMLMYSVIASDGMVLMSGTADVCGDGVCSAKELEMGSCAADCPIIGGPVCGNGECEDGELESCPHDCADDCIACDSGV